MEADGADEHEHNEGMTSDGDDLIKRRVEERGKE